ncbi:MAG: M66 family metalloprotease [Myxococcota bacterium]
MISHWVLLSSLGCNTMFVEGSPTGETVDPDPTVSGDDDDDDTTSTSTLTERPLAGGLTIDKISLYQGVESVLYEDGKKPTTLEMPVITQRDGLLRVFLDPDADFEERKVVGVLTIVSADGDEVVEEKLKVEKVSKDDDLDSTLNFFLAADQIGQSTEFLLEILETEPSGIGGGARKDVTWDSDKEGGLDTESTDDLTVVVVPVRYNADGSGRLPDTSAAQLTLIEELVRGTYPAQKVTVVADQPFDWDEPITPFNGNQWGDILDAIGNYRASKNEPPNTYYYGAFEPQSSVYSFCGAGCIAGLSYVGFGNDPFFRASVGLGYSGTITSETLVHEMGHAHGREHAPCGQGVSGIDPGYPYSGAALGSWGYDIVGQTLKDPNDWVDMMSYCTPIWISDYTFYSLYLRIQSVSTQRTIAAVPRTTLRLQDGGRSVMNGSVAIGDTSEAPPIEVTLFDADGQPMGTQTAALFPYSHVEGGLVVLDSELPEGWTAAVAD